MGIPWEDSETVIQDEGWGEVFEVARSKGDARENLLQMLDSDSMHLHVEVSSMGCQHLDLGKLGLDHAMLHCF